MALLKFYSYCGFTCLIEQTINWQCQLNHLIYEVVLGV